MFEELTVEPGSFVYLIRFLCWRKPKWKSHHSLREFAIPLSWKQPGQQSMSFYLSEGEWDTLKSKQGLVLCLRGRACVLCLSECASGGMLQQRTLSSTTDEESKLVLFFSLHVDRRASICSCSFSAGRSVRTYGSVRLCEHFCLFVSTVYGCVCVCLKLYCSVLFFLYGCKRGRACWFFEYKCLLKFLIFNNILIPLP